MTDQQTGDSAQEAVQGTLFSVGNMLREERLRHGMTVDDVYGRIKFAPRQIEALEADNFAELPEPAFVRGFVRSYAKLLQVDPEPLIAALPHAEEKPMLLEPQGLGEMPVSDEKAERRQNIIWLAAALGVAALLALVAWLVSGKPKEQPAPEPETQKSTVENLPLPEAVPVSAVPEAESPAPQTQQAVAPPPSAAPSEKPAPVVKPSAPATPVAPAPIAAAKPAATPPAPATPPAKPATAMPVPAAKVTAPPAMPVKLAPAAKPAAPAIPPATSLAKPATLPPAVKATLPSASSSKPASAVPAVPVKKVEAPAKPAAASSGSAAIRMSFVGDSWVQVRDKDGKVLLSVLGKPGMEQTVSGTPPFVVDVGYSSGVKLYYKGKQVDLAPHARLEVSHLTLE